MNKDEASEHQHNNGIANNPNALHGIALENGELPPKEHLQHEPKGPGRLHLCPTLVLLGFRLLQLDMILICQVKSVVLA